TLGRGVVGETEQGERAGVDRGHPAERIEPEDTCADAGEHRLDEAAARLRLLPGCLQRALLFLKIGSHPVEGARQYGNFLRIVLCFDAGGEVPAGDAVRSLYEP